VPRYESVPREEASVAGNSRVLGAYCWSCP